MLYSRPMIDDIIPLDRTIQLRAERMPCKTFIKFEGKKFTFRDIDRMADIFASFLLAKGVKRGDRVAIFCHTCPQYVAAYFGIIRAGAVVLPLNTLLAHEEIDSILSDAGAAICFYGADCGAVVGKLEVLGKYSLVAMGDAERFDGPAPPDPGNKPDDISTILYTSGTTGRPKGALLTHRNIISNALACAAVIHISRKDRFVVFLPLFHSFTYTVCIIIPILRGCMISLLPSVRPFTRVIKSLILDRITLFVAIPTVYKILADKDLPWFLKVLLRLRLCISGAAPLPVRVIHDFEEAFKVPLLEGYGLTEASPVVSLNPPEKGANRPGTVGLPLPGLEVRVVDDAGQSLSAGAPGELLVRGPNVMQGYLNKPEETAQAIRKGWLYTGDVAAIDTEGYIKIIDRKKDMIIIDGLNVYPYEVEEVLYRHPDVKDCAMIGVLIDDAKEMGVMYVAPKDGRKPGAKELRDYLSAHVAHYKVPRRFLVLDELPRNPTGKIMKKELRKQYAEKEQAHRD
ncbi:MAG TPA: long-chain fatty acid--CoA ligase [Nitrospiraceae bacterium]|nr:long-chain fatty acid--CoA ligase [Nitrospiraceae bacterium]